MDALERRNLKNFEEANYNFSDTDKELVLIRVPINLDINDFVDQTLSVHSQQVCSIDKNEQQQVSIEVEKGNNSFSLLVNENTNKKIRPISKVWTVSSSIKLPEIVKIEKSEPKKIEQKPQVKNRFCL